MYMITRGDMRNIIVRAPTMIDIEVATFVTFLTTGSDAFEMHLYAIVALPYRSAATYFTFSTTFSTTFSITFSIFLTGITIGV